MCLSPDSITPNYHHLDLNSLRLARTLCYLLPAVRVATLELCTPEDPQGVTHARNYHHLDPDMLRLGRGKLWHLELEAPRASPTAIPHTQTPPRGPGGRLALPTMIVVLSVVICRSSLLVVVVSLLVFVGGCC